MTLFIPPLDPDSVIWSGLPISPSEALKKYDVDDVRPSTELTAHLLILAATDESSSSLYAIPSHIVDQTPAFKAFEVQSLPSLMPAIDECRVIKDDYEIAALRKANEVSAAAHVAVLKAVKHASNERELEAIFLERCIGLGCREQAYHSIVASGRNAATLHYQKNNEAMTGRWNLLLDAGAEWECYCADVTRTFPIHGKFNKHSREIYEIVERMQEECFSMLKEGVLWESVHERAHEVCIEGLLQLGVFKGNKTEIFEKRTSVAFFPHGLGHYLGMDTHDTGGHPNYEDKDSMFRYLRVRGNLPAGSVITVEPGVYFCHFIIEPYLQDPEHAKYIEKDVLDKYWDVGGVRIEGKDWIYFVFYVADELVADDILIMKDGYENLTTAPKALDEVDRIMNN